MTDLADELRRFKDEVTGKLERLIAKAEMENSTELEGISDGADALSAAVAELREKCAQRRIAIVDNDGAQWVDGNGLAKLLGKSTFTIRNWRGDEKTPCTFFNRAYHYKLENVAKYEIGEAASLTR